MSHSNVEVASHDFLSYSVVYLCDEICPTRELMVKLVGQGHARESLASGCGAVVVRPPDLT